jgi:valyl-tRNA synthetase
MITGFDIIFFWVARMVMTTLQFAGVTAFRDVYINAIVRDAEGQKMSKSKGNTIDPLDVIDGIAFDALLEKSTQGLMLASHRETAAKRIKREFPKGIDAYGADALRFTFASLSTLGRTLNFDLKRCEGYRSFGNKLWNATRFVLMNCEGQDTGLDASAAVELSAADRWIVSRLQRAERAANEALAEYRFDVAARAVYEFVWDEYCDWYVEIAKVQIANGNEAQRRATRSTLIRVLEVTLRLAHPIIPFITEELWQKVAPLAGKTGESVMLAPYPQPEDAKIDEAAEAELAGVKEVVNAARNLRSTMGVPPAARVPMYLADCPGYMAKHAEAIKGIARISELQVVNELPARDAPVTVTPAGRVMLHIEIDKAAEKARLEKLAAKVEGEIANAKGKLSKPSFVDKAPPEVVEQERKRLADKEAELAQIRAQIGKLG